MVRCTILRLPSTVTVAGRSQDTPAVRPPPPRTCTACEIPAHGHIFSSLQRGGGTQRQHASCILCVLYPYWRPSEVAAANSLSLYWNGGPPADSAPIPPTGEGRALLGSAAAQTACRGIHSCHKVWGGCMGWCGHGRSQLYGQSTYVHTHGGRRPSIRGPLHWMACGQSNPIIEP